MNNGDSQAYPIQAFKMEAFQGQPEYIVKPQYGLTKRELFAMAAMQGLLAGGHNAKENFSHISTRIADEHLSALEGEGK